MTKEEKKEKLELYNRAKEAYYNGEEIMSDYEFDQLEEELGLTNKSKVGSKNNPSFTIKHPVIMGSLSKVQIHKNKEGNIDWKEYFLKAQKFFDKKKKGINLIITPKYDGCSFECEIRNEKIVQISTRGDGEYGKDLTNHLSKKIPTSLISRPYGVDKVEHVVYRGEVLVRKNTFIEKYQDQFANPRSFVSGVLNRDYSDSQEFQDMLDDLRIVIYDYREFKDGDIIDHDWIDLKDEFKYEFKGDIKGVLPDHWMINEQINNEKDFEEIYKAFEEYRHRCPFALDGIVIKPTCENRINNITETRPTDCVAIKFIPNLQETEVVNITWNVAKTGEYVPIIWVNPVEMDGKDVQKCSGSNYGNLLRKRVSIGSKIIMSLAGDIIPFLYKVTNTDNFSEDKLNLPQDSYEDDIHLMKILNDKDRAYISFVNSVISLAIPNIGKESAKKIFEYMTKDDQTTLDFFGEEPKEFPYNILLLSSDDIYFALGGGKQGQKAKKNFEEIIQQLSLVDIIKSCSFRFCGPKVAEQCANYLLSGEADFEHLANEGYQWIFDSTSIENNKINSIVESLGKTFDDFKIQHNEIKEKNSLQIPIIMTGEPNDYNSKGHFLQCHPEYRNTGSWKEVQIVFTNSLESNTGKMKKAREKGIEIRLY